MFKPKELPARVKVAWQQGASNWMGVVEAAINERIADPFDLSEIVFHLRHPERRGELPGNGEIDLIFEFWMLMNLIKARVGTAEGAGVNGDFGIVQIASFRHSNSHLREEMANLKIKGGMGSD